MPASATWRATIWPRAGCRCTVGTRFRPSSVRPWSRPSPWISLPCSRSEEHTSELQSQSNLVCRLLLEKKKTSLAPLVPCHSARLATHRPQSFTHIALPVYYPLRPSRRRLFNIALITNLESSVPHSQVD